MLKVTQVLQLTQNAFVHGATLTLPLILLGPLHTHVYLLTHSETMENKMMSKTTQQIRALFMFS